MQDPRDLARRDPWAQSVARALTPRSLAPAFAVERDLSDPHIWQESIWRSQRRREAIERQLNFGPVSAKRVAVPLAMLAAGLMVRDAASAGSDGLATFVPTATKTGELGAKRVAHRVDRVKPATVAGRKISAPPPKSAHSAATAAGAPARPKPPKDPMADGELTRGEHGSAVAAMQQKLGVATDGIYGPSTLSAVKTFQKGQGLVPDGRVGAATQAALAHPRPVAKPAHTAKPSRAAQPATTHHHHSAVRVHGTGVKALQGALGLPADGVFGRETAHAVRAFQRQRGLKADGVVGPATWSALGVRDPGRVLKQQRAHGRAAAQRAHRGGSGHASHHGTSVSDLQRLLGISADGVFGRQTARAVRDFQRHHGLRADGVVGPATWRALGVPNAQRVLHPRHGGPAGPRHSGGGGGGGGGNHASGVVAAAIAAGDRIATLPYKYGGGHGSFNDSGYDCSGSVSYVLHGAGLLSSPLDSTGLESYGAPGPGKHITIYANSGHAFMTIDGRRFDTGYGGEGNRWASGSRPTAGYVVRHPPGL